MPSTVDLERYMLIWLIRNTVRNKMGLSITKYEYAVPSKTQYTELVRKLLTEASNNSEEEEL